jgi:hypothetical protein
MRLFKIFLSVGVIQICLSTASVGQSLQMDEIAFTRNSVVIRYKLLDPKNRPFSVFLYSSLDNFSTPLKRVSGDVGRGVIPGTGKKIIWDIDKEYGDFAGDITFRISSTVDESFQVTRVFKKGKTYQIDWNPVSNLGENIRLELVDVEQRKVWEINDIPNVGKFNWKIPPRIKARDGYRLRFTNMDNQIESNWSNSFGIKARTPFMFKAIGLALIGGAAVYLISTQGSNNTNPLPDFSTIGFPDK